MIRALILCGVVGLLGGCKEKTNWVANTDGPLKISFPASAKDADGWACLKEKDTNVYIKVSGKYKPVKEFCIQIRDEKNYVITSKGDAFVGNGSVNIQ